MPNECEDVPQEILNPKNTWEDKNAYDTKANTLAKAFVNNFTAESILNNLKSQTKLKKENIAFVN